MRGTFFPDSVSSPPVGTGDEYPERDPATPIAWDEMVTALSRLPHAAAEGPITMMLARDAAWAAFFHEAMWSPTGQRRPGPSGRRTQRTRFQRTTWGGPVTQDPEVTQQPAGCAEWLAGIRGFGAERSSDTEGDGANAGQGRDDTVQEAVRSLIERIRPGLGARRTRRTRRQWTTRGGPATQDPGGTQQPAGNAEWLAGIRGFGAERSLDTEGDGANVGQGSFAIVREAVRSPTGRLRPGPWARRTRRTRGQWPTWGGPIRQALEVTQQPAGSAGWLAGIRGFGTERSSDTEGDGATAGYKRGEALRTPFRRPPGWPSCK
jgi:hypothetical protein